MASHNEQAQRMRRHLEQLCSDAVSAQVQGRGWGSRFLVLSTAIGMSAALGACYGGPMPPPESAETADVKVDAASAAIGSDDSPSPASPARTADEVATLRAESDGDTH